MNRGQKTGPSVLCSVLRQVRYQEGARGDEECFSREESLNVGLEGWGLS